MKYKNTIGIDFGTTNSFINRCPADRLISSPIILSSRETGLETAVLYIENKKIIIGNSATQTWGNATQKEKKDYILHLRFKPEIETSDNAQKSAIDFFTQLIELVNQKFGDITASNNKILIGVPSEASDNYKKCLKSIGEEAGFKNIDLIDEPVGALLFFLARNDITPTESREGVLIIDFGGGTCDFAWMRDLKVVSSWGDMLLGGCLFDDLFFKWWIDNNPTTEKKLKKDGAEYYFHWYVCKIIKEEFSNFMLYNQKEKWSYTYRDYGSLQNITWNEFIKRASSYIPTKSLIEYFKINKVSFDRLSGKPINLFKWFEDTLIAGLNIQSDINVNKVVLAGGSSLWLFVSDIIKKKLNISQKNILKCENPYSVVSQGISLYPALINIHEKAKIKLENNLDSFIKNEIQDKILEKSFNRLLNKIIEHLSIVIVDDNINTIIKNFKKRGGTFKELENHIKKEIHKFQSDLKIIIDDDIKEESRLISHNINKIVKEWFEDNGIKCLPDFMTSEKQFSSSISFDITKSSPYELEEKIMIIFGTFIIANLSGGGGIALIIAGFPGLIIGGLIGLLASFYGTKKFKHLLKESELPKFVLKILLSDSKIKNILKKIKESLKTELQKKLKSDFIQLSKETVEQIKKTIEKEIESVSLIASL